MNVLIITPELPWPPSTGGRAAQLATLDCLAGDHKFRLIYTGNHGDAHFSATALESRYSGLSVIFPTPPAPEGALKLRQVALSYAFKAIRVTGASIFFKKERRHSSNIDRPYFPFAPLASPVIKCIQDNLEWADLVQAEFHDSISVSFLEKEGTPSIFVCHQSQIGYVNSFYDSRSDKDHPESLIAEYDFALNRSFEKAALDGFDRVIVFSELEGSLLSTIISPSKVMVIPFAAPLDVAPLENLTCVEWGKGISFVGSCRHFPNVDGLDWFVKEVAPHLIRRVGQSRTHIHVYGDWNYRMRLRYDPNLVTFHGYTEELSPHLHGTISINPIRIGAGIRTKLLSYALLSSPIVSTSLGCSGMDFTHGGDCLIADEPSAFAEAIISLSTSPELCERLAKSAYSRIRVQYSPERIRQLRNELYQSLKIVSPGVV